MKRINLKKRLLAAVLTAGCLCSVCGMSAAAITVDDVAERARECGYSEEMIQLGYNEWATGNYTEADLQAIYDQLESYDSQVDDMVDSIFENTSIPDDVVIPTNPPATEAPSSSAAGGTASSGGTDSAENSTAGTGTVSSADFINMTLEQKIAYVNTMSEAEKDAFLANLTPEERNSIIKQMSLEDKAELMQGYIDTADTMGLNVVVDSLSDTNISVTVRNQDGVVVDKAAVGVTIDETGISHTRMIVIAAAGVMLSLLGLAALYRYLRRSDAEEQ